MNGQINTLPIDEKIRLVEEIWDSIAAEQSNVPITTAQKAELDSRLDAYQQDTIKGKVAQKAISRIKSHL